MLCRYCRCIFLGQRLSDELLEAHDAHDAHDDSFAFGEEDNNRPIVHKHLSEWQRVISSVMAINGLLHDASVLNIGGDIGGRCVHLVGKDNLEVVDAGNSIHFDSRISKVDGLFSGQLELESFDVAVFNHVLEHVFSPR